jgi:DNA-binding MarR family transcriptional regulator
MVRKEDYVALAGFRKALRRFLRFAEEGAREAGITPQQHQVLLAIAGRPNRDWASISELSDSLQLKHHATVGLVDRCQSAGLVRRTQNPDDRRIVQVSLTPAGEDIVRRLTLRNVATVRELGKMTEDLEELRDRVRD